MICAVRREKRISIIEQIKEPVLNLNNTKIHMDISVMLSAAFQYTLVYCIFGGAFFAVVEHIEVLTG